MNKPTKTQKRLAKAFASPARPFTKNVFRSYSGKHLDASIKDRDQCDEGPNAYHMPYPCPCPTCVKQRRS